MALNISDLGNFIETPRQSAITNQFQQFTNTNYELAFLSEPVSELIENSNPTNQTTTMTTTAEIHNDEGFTTVTNRRKKRQRTLSDSSSEEESVHLMDTTNSQNTKTRHQLLLLSNNSRTTDLTQMYTTQHIAYVLHKEGAPPVHIKKCGKGFLVSANDKGYLQTIKTLTNLQGNQVKYVVPNWEKQIKGVINFDSDLDDDDLKLCMNKANTYNPDTTILEINRIKSKGKNTKAIILTFKGTTLPTNICFGGLMGVKVNPLLKKPTQCTRCFEYSHSTKDCKNKQHCTRCSYDCHTYEQCTYKMFCAFCVEYGHSSISNKCPYKQKLIRGLNKHKYANQQTVTPKQKFNFNPPNSSSPKHTTQTEEQTFSQKTVPTSEERKAAMLQRIEQSILTDIRTRHNVTETPKTPNQTRQTYANIAKERKQNQRQEQTRRTQNQQPTKSPKITARQLKFTQNNKEDLRTKLNNNQDQINKTLNRSSTKAIDKLIEFITQVAINIIPSNTVEDHQRKLKRIYNLAISKGLYHNTFENMQNCIYVNKKPQPKQNRDNRSSYNSNRYTSRYSSYNSNRYTSRY